MDAGDQAGFPLGWVHDVVGAHAAIAQTLSARLFAAADGDVVLRGDPAARYGESGPNSPTTGGRLRWQVVSTETAGGSPARLRRLAAVERFPPPWTGARSWSISARRRSVRSKVRPAALVIERNVLNGAATPPATAGCRRPSTTTSSGWWCARRATPRAWPRPHWWTSGCIGRPTSSADYQALSLAGCWPPGLTSRRPGPDRADVRFFGVQPGGCSTAAHALTTSDVAVAVAVRHVDGDRHIGGYLQEGHHRDPVHVRRHVVSRAARGANSGSAKAVRGSTRRSGRTRAGGRRPGIAPRCSGRPRFSARAANRMLAPSSKIGSHRGTRVTVESDVVPHRVVGTSVPENKRPVGAGDDVVRAQERGFAAERAEALAEHHDLRAVALQAARTRSSTASNSARPACRAFSLSTRNDSQLGRNEYYMDTMAVSPLNMYSREPGLGLVDPAGAGGRGHGDTLRLSPPLLQFGGRQFAVARTVGAEFRPA